MGTLTKKRILLVGKLPPPIGGVTVHVQRLVSVLSSTYSDMFELEFYDLKCFEVWRYIFAIRSSDIIHIHSSSPYLRLLSVLLCRLFNKRSFVTVHGDLGRFGGLKNMTDLLAIKLSSFPILLNAKSFKLGSRLNTNAVLSSAFISSESKKDLQDVTVEEIYELKKSRILFATNAYAVSFDKNDKGIYGIFDLLTIFGSSNGVGLVISDPSSSYRNEINKRGVTVPGNVVMISYQHDFNSVLDLVDGFIRNTTTDGDSISVHEALYKNKLTLCSSCVDRPKGAVVYQNLDELREILKCPDELSVAAYVMPNSVQQLVRLYLT